MNDTFLITSIADLVALAVAVVGLPLLVVFAVAISGGRRWRPRRRRRGVVDHVAEATCCAPRIHELGAETTAPVDSRIVYWKEYGDRR